MGYPSIKRIWDLSQPTYHNCPGYPGNPLVKVELLRFITRDTCNMELLTTTTHSGTHVDAPLHLLEDGKSITSYDVEDFVGPCDVLDLTGKGRGEEISLDDIKKRLPRIEPGNIILLATGWGEKRAFTKEWVHDSPWLGESAAEYLAKSGIKGIGVDHFSIGTTDPALDLPCHLTLLRAGIWIAEDLFIPREVVGKSSLFYVGVPLRLIGASGAPVRPILLEFD